MLFSSLVVLLPICLITSVNPVVSVLCLVGLASVLAVYWFFTGLTFVSMLYILVYVGAVAILFLFVIITLDVRESSITESNKAWSKNLPVVLLVMLSLIIAVNSNYTLYSHATDNLLSSTLMLDQSVDYTFALTSEVNNLSLIGQGLYGYNGFGLILMVLLLLCAMICPLTICLKK